jgi:feruloyl-CoA synthase
MTPADGADAAVLDRPPQNAGAAPFKPLPMKAPDVGIERRPDGAILLWSNLEPGQSPRSIAHLLAEKAAEHPDRRYMGQRLPGHGPWRFVTYGEAKSAADRVAGWLLRRGLGQGDCVLILSGNSIEHALITLGGYTAGVPVAPVSPAYSLMSSDHEKLKHCFRTLKPKVVFAHNGDAFAGALNALKGLDADLTVVTVEGGYPGAVPFAELTAAPAGPEVVEAMDRLGPQTVAKYLFTSGSTGLPKGVPQTQGMMTAGLAGSNGLRTDADEPDLVPESLEWMPWSHISAGNIGFNLVLWSGGTVYLDEGKPLPGMFETTIKNLYEVSPITFGSAPIAFGMLAEAMEKDPTLRRSFFRNLRYMAYGGATLSTDVGERMQRRAVAETGARIPMITMYGATETQGITMVHWLTDRVGLVGLPLPGITLKLVPHGSKFEVRVKGPTVATGYVGDPEKTAAAFDEEGFYKLGDAARFVDPNDPAQGLVFDGRVTEDFKLDSGTWVSVGTLRPDVVAACSPYVHDVVIAGQDKPFAAALIWPSMAGLQALASEPGEGTPLERLNGIIAERLRAHNAGAGGSSRRIGRFLVMLEPPSIDSGEITDKGYVNQRATLERRADLVAGLYAEPPGVGVVAL